MQTEALMPIWSFAAKCVVAHASRLGLGRRLPLVRIVIG